MELLQPNIISSENIIKLISFPHRGNGLQTNLQFNFLNIMIKLIFILLKETEKHLVKLMIVKKKIKLESFHDIFLTNSQKMSCFI